MGNCCGREWARARVEYKFMIIYDATYAIACSKKERAWACNVGRVHSMTHLYSQKLL